MILQYESLNVTVHTCTIVTTSTQLEKNVVILPWTGSQQSAR